MKINNFTVEDLLRIKAEKEKELCNVIEQLNCLENLQKERVKSDEENKLSDLVKGDKIFCIKFYDTVYYMNYVNIYFDEFDNDYTKFIAKNDSDGMWCSDIVDTKCKNNHYFLSEGCSTMYFFTLYPETWITDLRTEMKRLSKMKKQSFKFELDNFKNKINSLINNDDVENLILTAYRHID
jgi:hypothetical protein